MSTEPNRGIVRSFYEDGFNKGDLESVRAYIAPSFVSHNPIIGELSPGFEGYKQLVAIHRRAFPDIRVKIEEMIANVDRVIVRWTWRGTHQGHFMGVAPTGSRVTVTACIFSASPTAKSPKVGSIGIPTA